MSQATSGLAKIEFSQNTDPIQLLSSWLEESKNYINQPQIIFNLATATAQGIVSNCTLVLRAIRDDKFIFMTNKFSQKAQHISENPHVSGTFCLQYRKGESLINRQVRFQGVAKILSDNLCEELYQAEPLYCKIRSHICDQGHLTDWNHLKTKHDTVLRLMEEKLLGVPDNLAAYKIIPEKFDFYYGFDSHIADRITFSKDTVNSWLVHRVCA